MKIPKPRSLQHPPAPIQQETDTSFIVGAIVVGAALMVSGVLVKFVPGITGLGPPETAVATDPSPTPSDPTASALPGPTQAPVADTGSASGGGSVVQSGRTAAAPAGSGGGGTTTTPTLPTAPLTVTGIAPVDDLIKTAKDRLRIRNLTNSLLE